MFKDRLGAEFKKRRIFYTYHDSRVFYCAQWKFPHPIIFVVIRLLLSAYTLFGFIHYFVRVTPFDHIMIFFTTWSYVILTLHLALTALLSVIFYRKVHYRKVFDISDQPINSISDSQCIEISQRQSHISTMPSNGHEKGRPPNQRNSYDLPTVNGNTSDAHALLKPSTAWYFKLSWCLSEISLCAAPVVTSIYFSAIYPSNGSGSIGLIDLNVHILNTVFMVIDFAVSARPIRLLHVVAPILYGLSWLVFSIIYWSTDHDGHIVYDMIDWNKAGPTMGWVCGILLLLVVIKVIFFSLYKLKIWLYTIIHQDDYFVDLDRD